MNNFFIKSQILYYPTSWLQCLLKSEILLQKVSLRPHKCSVQTKSYQEYTYLYFNTFFCEIFLQINIFLDIEIAKKALMWLKLDCFFTKQFENNIQIF